MGRWDADFRPRQHRESPENRLIRWQKHMLRRAEYCACGQFAPVECLCCGKRLCFFCAGVMSPDIEQAQFEVGAMASFDDLDTSPEQWEVRGNKK